MIPGQKCPSLISNAGLVLDVKVDSVSLQGVLIALEYDIAFRPGLIATLFQKDMIGG